MNPAVKRFAVLSKNSSDDMNTERIIANISKHIKLDEEETGFFLSLLKTRKLKKKELLLRAGDICRYESFVTQGCLRNYYIDENGVEHIVMFAIEGWWISDLYSLLTQQPARFSIEALEETEVLQISKDDLEQLYIKVPKFDRLYRILFQNAFIAQENRITQNLALTAEQRYLQFLQKYPALEQRVPQKQIAAFLGMTPEFLSMIRRKLSGK
jgi:CRP-like cAMP-binding protein